ncbi:uncharacterized protein LOC117976337 isoform X2 [Pan paniscus]|uniref:uncharacterized protein LOC117976337 isoform X2 n=1 Tax=Pan paniscus TaxID=9597 RepID=UPI00300553A3
MAAPLLHTRLPGDAAASSSAVKTLGASRTGISNMRALENDFFNSPPRKTVRFGGTVTEVLLKYKKGETNDFELLKNQLLDPDIKNLKIGSSENIRHRMSLPSTLQQNFRTLNFGFIISQEGSFSLEEDGILDVNSFSQDHRSRLLVFMNFFFLRQRLFFFFFFFDMESRSSRSSWSGIARSWITAPFTSQIQAILVPQPPEPLRLQAHAIMPDFPGPDSQSCPQCPAASRAPSVTKMQRSGRHCAAPGTCPYLAPPGPQGKVRLGAGPGRGSWGVCPPGLLPPSQRVAAPSHLCHPPMGPLPVCLPIMLLLWLPSLLLLLLLLLLGPGPGSGEGAAMATTVVTLELRRPAAAPRQSATPGSASIRASCANSARSV